MPKKQKKNARRAGGRRITPEDLLRMVFVGDPQIAPDGQTIAFARKHIGEKNQYVTNLWVVDTEDGVPRQFTAGERDSSPRWSRDGSRIAFRGGRDKTRPQVYTIDADGGEATALTSFPEGSIGSFKWSPDGTMLAVAFREQDPDWTSDAKKGRNDAGLSDPPRVLDHWWYRLDGDGYFNGQRYHLYIVDAETGEHRKLYDKDTLGFFSFDFSPDSKEVVVGTNRDKRCGMKAWNDELLRIRISSGRVRRVPNLPKGPKDNVQWSPDGKWIAWAGRRGGDSTYSTENLELWLSDPKTGKSKSLTGREDYCLMAVALSDTAEAAFGPNFTWTPDGKRLLVQLGWHGETHIATVTKSGRIELLTRGAVAHWLGNVSADGRRVAMTIASATKPDEVHVGALDGESLTSRACTSFNRKMLAGRTLSRPKSHWVTAADGTKVQTWVMMPPGHSGRRKVPAVLEIHGGPHAQYGVGFFHEFQVLAAAGYAVFYSNPRGSKGYGQDHCRAIQGDWGGADWEDIQAVTAFMKEQPFVDAKRMGIMGGSYGGYMTNWAIGHTNEFAGAITDRCVSNLVSMFNNSDFPSEPDRYFPGNAWDQPEELWRQSPIRHFNKVRTPTLIIHSEGDLRCNVEQADQVFASLSVRNVPTRYVRYPASTSHGMSRAGAPDMRLHRLEQILDWWKRYLA